MVADHLGDTVETVIRVYAHWLRGSEGMAGEIMGRAFGVALFPGYDAPVATKRDRNATGHL
jgi:hypothetical protein